MAIDENILKQRVYENSLQTCEYIGGYENQNSDITVKCLIHDYIFQTRYENVRRSNRKHHICPLCKQQDINNNSSKIECECAYCHKKFMRAPSNIQKSKSGLLFCCREHKDLAQRIDTGEQFQIMRPAHYNTGIFTYRDKAYKAYLHECAICGWNEDDSILEVHHIDEDRNHNDLNNLIILCPTCHRKLTSHRYKLIDRIQIQKI